MTVEQPFIISAKLGNRAAIAALASPDYTHGAGCECEPCQLKRERVEDERHPHPADPDDDQDNFMVKR